MNPLHSFKFISNWVHEDDCRTHQVSPQYHLFYGAVEVDHVIDDLELQFAGECAALGQHLDAVYQVLGLSGVESRPVWLYVQDLQDKLTEAEKARDTFQRLYEREYMELAAERGHRKNAERMWESYKDTTELMSQWMNEKEAEIERLKAALTERR